MSIEIRQLSIKSSVTQQADGGRGTGTVDGRTQAGGCGNAQDSEETRNDLLAACREMVLDLLSRSKER
ncbi:hypothetical protein SAMN04515620_11130 [Collimonas sp. OK607]|uniref:DUF5908 family protein n=1 Tax=Collimonas sp. OK607 TaxID=1798194 RepID=UPI0008EEF6EC|nr:DUF5908 family protein [Collimonas sp. OK607]SFA98909.1 hypothetical protein SAMN04515620_11130 [Collimonas sp. OK607]